ncbi:hypothetical protein ABID21_001951 [Pseudorhizobium tarimense]|uniref:Uncharacterized protein n=2 Tax=Pseudorhizobium tarimense TaxID=1079109 RepID=A0ABV2H5Z5_9HYPH
MPDTFYHGTRKSDFFIHNVKVGKGWFRSASASAKVAGLENVTTPYALFHRDGDKEAVWERVREQNFPDRPPRLKAIFMFASLADAESSEWFKGEDRALIAVKVPVSENIHVADASWLDSPRSEWETCARRYWEGALTEHPKLEVLLDGSAYAEEWEAL